MDDAYYTTILSQMDKVRPMLKLLTLSLPAPDLAGCHFIFYIIIANKCMRGTVRKIRKGLSKFDEKLKRGVITFRTSKNLNIIKWLDKKKSICFQPQITYKYDTCDI